MQYCYELTLPVLFWTDDWDCRLINYTHATTHRLPYFSLEALHPGIVYCLALCYCLAPCTVSPCAIASPRVLSRPVDCLALCHCLALYYCLAPTTLTTIKTCIYALRSLKLLLKSIS